MAVVWGKLAVVLAIFCGLAAANSVDLQCFGSGSGSVTEAFLSEPVSKETKEKIDDGERAFSVNLIKTLFRDFETTSDKHHNVFVSPASVYQTLMLAYMGANGQTRDDLAMTMGLGGDDDDGLGAVNRTEFVKNYLYERAYQAVRDQDPNLGYELTHANKLYFDRELPLSKCLQLVLQDELEALDFTKAEKARKHINSWVSDKTKAKIPELLSEAAVDASSKVVLVNAAYFKGEWASKFQKTETKTNNFYVARDTIRVTDFMEQKGKFNYYTSEELRAHVLEMPYVGQEVSMMVILPPFEENSLYETVQRLTPDTLKGVMSEVKSGFYSVDDLTVRMPRFKIEQKFDLSSALQDLGLNSLFDPLTSDLSGFLADPAADRVSLAKAVHKSFVEVNEEGSEAAAATALFGFRSARPLFHTEFYANHPFLFLIYDKPSDTILFFGVYQDPML